MAAEKRNFTDFNKFPGVLSEGKQIYEFPLLHYTDDLDRMRSWQIFIRIVKEAKIHAINWNLLDENQLVFKPEYIVENTIDKDIIAEVWVENGIIGGQITRCIPTYFTKVAFEGRSNQRNQVQQAMIYARAQFLKKKEKGGSELKSGIKKIKGPIGTAMHFPMLAKSYKDAKKYIKFPLYLQPKLDGVRCLAYLKKKNGGADNVVLYSRTQKEFPSVDYLKVLLYDYLNDLFDVENSQSIFLDGELYQHGKKLQDISGMARKSSNGKNEYHIYDCFYPEELYVKYSDRKKQLDHIFSAIIKNAIPDELKYLHPVETILINDENTLNKQFNAFIKNKYEGAICRNPNGCYLANPTKTGSFMRSNDLIKMKKKFTDEFEVIGFTDGTKGKDKGAIIWILKNSTGHIFNVTPKDISYEERYKLFIDCQENFNKKYKNRLLTVEYEDLSKNGVPQRAKALTFRDYE